MKKTFAIAGCSLLLVGFASGCSSQTSEAPIDIPVAQSTPAAGLPAADVSKRPGSASAQPSTNAAPAIPVPSPTPSLQLDGSLPSYNADDMRSAYEWTNKFIPAMYSYTNYWANGNKANGFIPQAYWPFSSFVLPSYWDNEIAPKIFGRDELNANADQMKQLGPLPPKIDGLWSNNPVGDFVYGNPEFSQDGEKLVVGVPYTASAVYNSPSGVSFYAIPITGQVKLSLVRDGSDWKIVGWDNPPPEYGSATKTTGVPQGRSAAAQPEEAAPAPTQPVDQAELDRIREENLQKYGSPSPS